jgi:hypothetical protein
MVKRRKMKKRPIRLPNEWERLSTSCVTPFRILGIRALKLNLREAKRFHFDIYLGVTMKGGGG